MDYLTYEEFCEYPLGVTVTESEFPTLEFYAEIQLDRITYGHINKESPPKRGSVTNMDEDEDDDGPKNLNKPRWRQED